MGMRYADLDLILEELVKEECLDLILQRPDGSGDEVLKLAVIKTASYKGDSKPVFGQTKLIKLGAAFLCNRSRKKDRIRYIRNGQLPIP